MNAARAPRPPADGRLLRIDPCAGALVDAAVTDLPALLKPGDLLVVNDAATLPASLRGTGPSGRALELRLAGERADGGWNAVAFGPGDWRTPTEHRDAPEPLAPGDEIRLGSELSARVTAVSALSPRLVVVSLHGSSRALSREALWPLLYRVGRPVQYSYLERPLEVHEVQTRYAGRPVAAESPSAGRPLTWSVLTALKRAGVELAVLTHAAGLSATGAPELDAALPFPERFEIPERTVRQVAHARSRGGRVVAVGTTVTRALEGAAAMHGGRLRAGCGETDLKIGPGFTARIVDGILSGVHEPGTSHFALLLAFARVELLEAAAAHAEREGYLIHEFGDSVLILCS